MKWSTPTHDSRLTAHAAHARPTKLLRRHITFKSASVGDDGSFEGYGSIFDIRDNGGDIVVPGAFIESLKMRRPSLLWQHEATLPVGVWDEIDEDGRGLVCKGRIGADFDLGRQALWLVRNGGLDGLSIGYDIVDHEMDRKNNARILKQLGLWEISLVTWPMNEESRIGRRAAGAPEGAFQTRGASGPRPTVQARPTMKPANDLAALAQRLRAI